MKMRSIVTCSAAFMLTAQIVGAAHIWEDSSGWWDTRFRNDPNTPKFTDTELSLDLFGSYTAAEEKFSHLFQTNIRHGNWGGGVGLNHFFVKYAGIGADVNMSDHPGRIVDQAMGNLILRFPIESIGLAPYIFGGGGRGVYPDWEWVYDGGVGLEFRFTPGVGIFSDARYIWAEKTTDRLLIRAGLRLLF